jgi:hypothetical protein
MRMTQLSTHLVNVMQELIKNQGIAMLLANDTLTPFDTTVADPSKLLMTRIHPVPFDIDATTTDGTFIRVYYNQGQLSGDENITEAQILIDIVCSKPLWLISEVINGNKTSLIRPYEIMDRVVDMLGKNSINSKIRLEFDGFQHLYINTKFDCVRLYANYWEIEV